MTNGEIQAMLIADKYEGETPEFLKLKKLGEEFVEFINAVITGSDNQILDEAGDVCFLILHIISKRMPEREIGLTQLVLKAADKMEERRYKQRKKK